MTPKKILVLFGLGGRDLKSVHHALALAERLEAHVFILQWKDHAGDPEPRSGWIDEALSDVIANARMAGLNLSHLTAAGSPDTEVVSIVEEEGIDLLVLSSDESRLESELLRRRPQLSGHIIRVKEKTAVDVAGKEG